MPQSIGIGWTCQDETVEADEKRSDRFRAQGSGVEMPTDKGTVWSEPNGIDDCMGEEYKIDAKE